MYRQIELDPERIKTKQDMKVYLTELFRFEEEYAAVNLDALNDSLSEITDQIDIILTPDSIMKICDDAYSYKVLLVLGRAAEENPNIKVLFREGTPR